MLDKDSNPVAGTSIDGIFNLALIAYLIGLVWKAGRTVGDRVVGVRVLDAANRQASSVPLGKVIYRYLAMLIGVVPVMALVAFQYARTGGSADAIFTASFFQMFAVAGAIGGVWVVVLIIQIVMKTDPAYDRLAETAVVLKN